MKLKIISSCRFQVYYSAESSTMQLPYLHSRRLIHDDIIITRVNTYS